MDKFSTTSDNLEEAGEDILTNTISDEEIEAAASMESGDNLEEADEDILPYTISDEEIELAASIESGTTWYYDTRWPAYCC
jgi:hypothetical protein